MTRCGWMLSVAVGLGMVLAPGCTHTESEHVELQREPRRELDAGPGGGGLVGSPYHPVAVAPSVPETKPDAAVEQARYPQPPREREVAPVKPPPAPVETTEQPPPAAPAGPPVETAVAVKEDEPLVAALRCFLDKRPADAVAILNRYDKVNQELLLSLLPLAVRLTDTSVDRASQVELTQLIDQLHSLSLPLRRRADLRIARICFCKPDSIRGFGIYEPLPEGQAVFQGGRGGKDGDLVVVYAEMRNFNSELQREFAVTRLKSWVEIRNLQGKVVWSYDQFSNEPDVSRTLRQDYFINYTFHVPAHLAPGSYTLVVQVQDVLAQPLRPPAMRSLEFCVMTASGTAQAPRGGPGMASRLGGGGL
jgi:hypothetical protein